MGFVVVPAAQLATVQKTAVAVLELGRNWKANPFHWRSEPHSRRLNLLVDTVLGYGLPAYSVTLANVAPGQEEAARVACLEAGVLELAPNGVIGVTIDKRNPSQIQRDRRTMLDIIRHRVAPTGFRYGFEWPSLEPALWIADALAGATSCELAGDTRYTVVLGAQLQRLQA